VFARRVKLNLFNANRFAGCVLNGCSGFHKKLSPSFPGRSSSLWSVPSLIEGVVDQQFKA
jgi:hypothetical protein